MRTLLFAALAASLCGCAVERIGPPGGVAARYAPVPARDVAIFETADMVKDRFRIVEELTVHDDGTANLSELQRDLRVMAGARGANAIIMAPGNRHENGTRAVIGLQLGDPFDSYSATAIRFSDGPPQAVSAGWAGEARLPMAGEVMAYAALAEVPGSIEALGEIEVANKGESRAAIEARLRAEAKRIGANAIVFHPFNRYALGAQMNTGGWDNFDPFRNSRATALLVETAPPGPDA